MIRKLGFFSFGVVLALVFLEGALVLLHRGAERAQRSAGDSNSLRVVALGESTTTVAGDSSGKVLIPHTSYPARLGELLAKSLPKVKVENAGVWGGDSDTVLHRFEEILRNNPPKVALVMMGMMDTSQGVKVTWIERWLGRIRVFELGRLLMENFYTKGFESTDSHPRSMAEIPPEFRVGAERWLFHTRETRLIEDFPEKRHWEDRLLLAVYFWRVGQLDEAVSILKSLESKHSLGSALLARVELMAGRSKDAIQTLEAAIRRNPEEGLYRSTLGDLLVETGNFSAAEKVLRSALERKGPYWKDLVIRSYLHASMAGLERARGNFPAALRHLESMNPGLPVEHFSRYMPPLRLVWEIGMGETFMGLRRWEDAAKHLERAVEVAPDASVHLWHLARIYGAMNRPDLEESTRKQVMGRVDRVGELFALGRLVDNLRGRKEAVAVVREGMKRIPKTERNWRRLIEMAHARGVAVVAVQYPGYPKEFLGALLPADAKVPIVDTENIFAGERPGDVWFEPRLPYVFSHYTARGAKLLAERLVPVVLGQFQ